jgi:hypothetical protein
MTTSDCDQSFRNLPNACSNTSILDSVLASSSTLARALITFEEGLNELATISLTRLDTISTKANAPTIETRESKNNERQRWPAENKPSKTAVFTRPLKANRNT